MGLIYIKTGAASAAAAEKQKQEAKQKAESRGKAFRFWMKNGEDAQVTFVDGELQDGRLLPPRVYEHNLFLSGKYGNFFVCLRQNSNDGAQCPLCDSGDDPYLAALFTIIDHRTFKSKDGKKSYTNTRKLFVAKTQTFEILNKLAHHCGGLAGQKISVSRSAGDKTPSVGDLFIPVGTKITSADGQKMYTREVIDPTTNKKEIQTLFVPLEYAKEIVVKTVEELNKMGHGKPAVTGMTTTTEEAPTEYEDEM